jgi:hypothetical protein
VRQMETLAFELKELEKDKVRDKEQNQLTVV